MERTSFTVKDWDSDDQPRERLISRGKKELSNAELIAILIGSGTPGQSSVELAQEILNRNGNSLAVLSRHGIKDLTKEYKGIGEAKAVTIIAALELGYRLINETNTKTDDYITDSRKLFSYISPILIDQSYEEFWVVYLNIRNKILFKQQIATGGLTDVNVDLRKIFSIALEKNAVKIALAHNHPSGHLRPSREDLSLTRKVKEAGNILNIGLTDHIIVGIADNGKPDYFSFNDNGLIP